MSSSPCQASSRFTSRASGTRRLLLAGAAGALAAFGLSAYLTAAALSTSTVAGCGPGSGCGDVLASSWSRWLGIPVGLAAAGVYALAVLAAGGAAVLPNPRMRRYCWHLLPGIALTVVGAAVWFVYVMLAKVGATCAYCTAAHALGILTVSAILAAWVRARRSDPTGSVSLGAAALSGLVGVAALGLLIAGQVLRPVQRYQVRQWAQEPAAPSVLATDYDLGKHEHGATLPASDTPYDRGTGPDRRITPTFTPVALPVQELPVLGSRDAKHMLVFLGDYLCPECQELHRMLLEVLDQYQGQLGVIMMPFPLNPKCNSWFKDRGEMPRRFARSCEMARLALAVHRADAGAFGEWDAWVARYGGTPPLAEALNHAVEKVGRQALDHALSDPWINQQIELSVELFRALPPSVQTVPVLLLPGHYVSGLPDRLEALCQIIETTLRIQPTDQLQALLREHAP